MIDYHWEDPQSEKNTSHGSTMSLMRTAVIGQRLEKFFNSQLFPDSLLARADHCTSMKLEEEEKNKKKKRKPLWRTQFTESLPTFTLS